MVAAYDDSGRADQTYGNTGPGAKLNLISFVGVTFGLLLVVNRLFWRWKKGTPGIDDLIIVFAWLTLLGLGIITFIAVDYGYGRHSMSLTRKEASDAIRMFYLYQIFYKLTLNLSKLSILTLYLRVFDTKDWFGNITKFLLFIVTTYTTSILMANIFICRPISTYWSTTGPSHHISNNDNNLTQIHPGTCINILAYWYASSLYNILSETLMLLSVLCRIWTLPSHSHPPILQFRQKINLTIVLGLGVFTVITAILRMTTLNQTAMASDRTGGSLTSTIWSSVEAGLGLAVANLPMVRQLLRWKGWCGGRWFRSSAGKSRSRSRSRELRGGRGGEYMGAGGGQCFGSKTLVSRNPSAAGIGGGGGGGGVGVGIGLRTNSHGQKARTYTDTHPSSSFHEITELHRDPERQASSTVSDDGDIDTDLDGYTSDIDSVRPLQHQNHRQHQPVTTRHSPPITTTTNSPNKPYATTTTTVRSGSTGTSDSSPFTSTSTPSPSVTSTSLSTSTLRNPTAPVPMVRISTEPSAGTTVAECFDRAKTNIRTDADISAAAVTETSTTRDSMTLSPNSNLSATHPPKITNIGTGIAIDPTKTR